MSHIINPLKTVRAFTKHLERALESGDGRELERASRELDELAAYFKQRTFHVPLVIPTKDHKRLWRVLSEFFGRVINPNVDDLEEP